jgi:hypothetical protein
MQNHHAPNFKFPFRLSLDLSRTLINRVSKLRITSAKARRPIALIEKSSVKRT